MSFPGRFRVWDMHTRRWLPEEDYLVKPSGGVYLKNEPIWLKGRYVVVWSTGLFDKNGKEIFEGDVVEWDDGSNGQYWRVAIVRFDPDICFEITENTKHPLSIEAGYKFHYGAFSYSDTHNHLTILGSIYENPELLK